MFLSWDLTTTPLVLKVGQVAEGSSHLVLSVGSDGNQPTEDDKKFSMIFSLSGAVDTDPAKAETTDYKASIDFRCKGNNHKLEYTYKNSLKSLGTAVDWYVMYSYNDVDGKKKLGVSAGADLAKLTSADGLLTPVDADAEVPADCQQALATTAGAGAFLKAQFLVSQGDDKLTLVIG